MDFPPFHINCGCSVESWTEDCPSRGNNYQDFKDAVGFKESTDNYQAVNQFGYMGRYQFGLLATSHLVGIGGLKKALGANDLTSVKDGNGTTAKEYMELFGGYDLNDIK